MLITVISRYNSAVFTSLASNDYTVAVVNKSFLSGGKWNLTAAGQRGLGDPGLSWVINNSSAYGWRIPVMTAEETVQAMQVNGSAGLYTMTNISQCFQIYNDYWAALGNVIIIVSNQSVQGQVDDTLLIYATPRSCPIWTIGQKINGRQQMAQKPIQRLEPNSPRPFQSTHGISAQDTITRHIAWCSLLLQRQNVVVLNMHLV